AKRRVGGAVSWDGNRLQRVGVEGSPLPLRRIAVDVDKRRPRLLQSGRGMRGESTGLAVVPTPAGDSSAIDWGTAPLPDAWPDRLRLQHPADLRVFLGRLLARRRRVEVPDGLPGGDSLPEYLRQEFHHLPNGNYSKRIVKGYSHGFDLLMLGRARKARAAIARQIASCRAVLDVGCGSGGLAGQLVAAGVPDVWGLDASPYLL